jgi:hypothetical protein
VLFALFLYPTPLLGSQNREPNADVIALMDSVAKTVEEGGWWSKEDIYAARSQAASSRDPRLTACGIVNLMRLGQPNDVQLTWWRSRNEGVRKLCLVLLLMRARDRIVLDREQREIEDYITRFEVEERTKRRRELDEVLLHARELREKMELLFRVEGKPGNSED